MDVERYRGWAVPGGPADQLRVSDGERIDLSKPREKVVYGCADYAIIYVQVAHGDDGDRVVGSTRFGKRDIGRMERRQSWETRDQSSDQSRVYLSPFLLPVIVRPGQWEACQLKPPNAGSDGGRSLEKLEECLQCLRRQVLPKMSLTRRGVHPTTASCAVTFDGFILLV